MNADKAILRRNGSMSYNNGRSGDGFCSLGHQYISMLPEHKNHCSDSLEIEEQLQKLG